ncbi:MAG TPA: PA14 domain-containing protein, partial [Pirellulales bacterium]|nr:PA14 domain-containing protein [Pirellulales bacterium]
MPDSFDPYRKWLGIATPERPPNHYELLGVELFESDEETIGHAAERRIAYLRSLDGSEHADLRARILNELAAAKACLLSRAKKADYDRRLRATLPGPPVKPPPVVRPPAALVQRTVRSHPGAEAASPVIIRNRTQKTRQKVSQPFVVALLIGALVFVALPLGWLATRWATVRSDKQSETPQAVAAAGSTVMLTGEVVYSDEPRTSGAATDAGPSEANAPPGSSGDAQQAPSAGPGVEGSDTGDTFGNQTKERLPSQSVDMKFVATGGTARAGGFRPIRAELDATPDLVKKAPEGLAAPKYGILVLGDRRWSAIVDEPEGKPAKLYVDTNADGDLTNDPGATWTAKTNNGLTMHEGRAQVELGEESLGWLNFYRFDPNDPQRAQLKNTLLFYTDYGYEITLNLDGREFIAFMSGKPSADSSLWIDRDGNQRTSYKREVISVGKPFNFTGTTYLLALNDGKLTLGKAAVALPLTPPPPDLAIGKKALPFTMAAMDGTMIDFPKTYAGKLVMLDFWATWCPPCVVEVPNVKTAYDAWHDQGFEIVGISLDDKDMAEKLAAFTKEKGMPWPQLYEGKQWDTTLGGLYDVSAIPFALLVDGDSGEILGTAQELRGPGLSDFIGKALAKKSGHAENALAKRKATPVSPESFGLKAELFRGIDFGQLVKTRIDPQIDFMWGQTAPDPDSPDDGFSIRWTGWLKPPKPGPYKLIMLSDDCTRLWLDGTQIFNFTGYFSQWRCETTVNLTGEAVAIRAEYYDLDQSAICSLRWIPPGRRYEQPIPAGALFHDEKSAREAEVDVLDADFDPSSGNGLTAVYYGGDNFQTRILERIDPEINWIWGQHPPAPQVPDDHFSVRWKGWLRAPNPGTYRLILVNDDGARLWLDGRTIVDDWRDHVANRTEVAVKLTARPVPIQVEYWEGIISAILSLRWIPPNSNVEQVIPRECLFQVPPAADRLLLRENFKAEIENSRTPALAAVARKIVAQPLLAHKKPVLDLEISSDGHWLATGGLDGTARLWDLKADDPGATPVTLDPRDGSLEELAISSDNHWLATGSQHATARLWDLRSSDPSAKFIPLVSQRAVQLLAFTPDTHWLATGGFDGTPHLWDLTAGDPAAAPVLLDGQRDTVRAVVVSPDGRWLATSGQKEHATDLRLWDLRSVPQKRTPIVLQGSSIVVYSIAFSPDGKWLAVGGADNAIKLWPMTDSGAAANPIVLPQPERAFVVGFSADSQRVASGSFSGTVYVWDLRAPGAAPTKPAAVLNGHTGLVFRLIFTQDGRWLATASGDNTARLWDLSSPRAQPTCIV